ncbi:MAG: hypothetical protein QFB89_00160 [Pseudomonadota bacterium]|nr:hypothetical protein [Pseudomonadota bacterium]
MSARLWLVGAATAVALSSTVAVASVVVVRSLGPSSKAYPPGKTLTESAKITLQGGDVVTVLGPNSAQTLRGPGNFNTSTVSLASAAGKRGRFGALRAGEIAKNPSVWDIDATQDGKVCITDVSKLQLWRPDSEAEASVNIRTADGTAQPVTWVAGNSSVAWPANLPLVSGADYQIEWQDTGEKSTVTIVKVPPSGDDLVDAAQVLIQNGCNNQLDVLVDSASKMGK